MVAEIVLISLDPGGTESARQSAQYVARGLSAIGHKVREQISVCENIQQLQQAVARALKRSHILVTLGGLGREAGYMTKKTIAQGLGLPLAASNEALDAMRSYCTRTGEPYAPEDNELANLPQGSVPFPGAYGKIPGFAISSSKQHIILLPENQNEIIPMFNKHVSPYLGGKETTTVTRTVRTYGVTEQYVRDALAGLMANANPALTVQREQNDVLVRVSANADMPSQAAALCTPVLQTVVEKLGDAAYGLDVDSLQSALITKLNKKELDVALAEAGTGGMLTRVIAETEGGQEVLRYSVAVDENEAKTDKLGIPKKLLKKRGGVSEYAAVQMASAVREKAHTGVGIAIAASTTATETKKCPPGLVYIAVCDAEYVYVKKLIVGDGDTMDDTIIDAALSRALNMARLFVDYLPSRYPGAISLIEALDGKTVTDKDRYVDELDDSGRPEEDTGEKKPGKGDIVRKIAFTLALLVFLGSAGYLGYTAYKSHEAKRIAHELNNLFGDFDLDEIPEDYPSEYTNLKFAGLWSINPDVRGFIRIDGTQVNYPIVQKYDNDYYLRRDFYEKSNQHGVPFFDFRVDVEKPSDNMVVYGHNMTDGQLFGELIKYRDLEYYQEHPVIDFSTVYEDAQYKVISIFVTNAYPNQGHVFDYYNFIEAENTTQYEEFLEQLRYRSVIDIPVDAEPGDELITLSTCSYELKDMRTVVVARKLRKGEKADVDVSAAQPNPQPLYPDVWYQKFGGTKPSGIDDTWSVGQNASAYIGYKGDETAPQVIKEYDGGDTDDDPDTTDMDEWASQRAESRRQESSRLAEEARNASEANELARQESEAAERSRLAESSRLAQESQEAAEAAERSRLAESSRLAEESRESAEAAERSRLAESSRLAQESQEAEEAAERSRREASRLAEASASQQAVEEMAAQAAGFSASPMSFSAGELTVSVGGSKKTGDALSIVAGVVENEVGPSFNTEAIKAQAVASYTFIAEANASGKTPSVYMNSSVSDKVRNAVSEVIGQAMYYNGSYAFTPYHATSAGATTTSHTVWGGDVYPYLRSVESTPDRSTKYFEVDTKMSSSEVASRLSSRLGIQTSGDPGSWFEVLSRNDGGYIGDMRVCGQTTGSSGNKITGRVMRETVLNLRSANFDIYYDGGSDQFIFTTYGYGHGVGMSQNGANGYAAQGWGYREILQHYYPGVSIQ